MGFRGLGRASLQVLVPATSALLLPWQSCFTPAALAPATLPGGVRTTELLCLLGGLQQVASDRALRSASVPDPAAANASTSV